MATKKATAEAAQEHATKLREFILFPTKMLQEILYSHDGFEKCIKIGIYHSAIKIFEKDGFRVSGKELLMISREFCGEEESEFRRFSSISIRWLNSLSFEDESYIINEESEYLTPTDEIKIYAAIRRAYALLNLQKSIDKYMTVFSHGTCHNNLNWKKSLVSVEISFIFDCRDFAEKSVNNERERILFCLQMAIASIIGLRRDWATTNQALIKARMFGFDNVKDYNNFMACKTSPEWLKTMMTKYTTRRIFDGLIREIKERGWCKTIEGTPYRCTVISITKNFPEISNEVNGFFGKKMGKKNVHL